MLVGAGVNVVMTRTGDTRVNRKSVDWTRDGEVGYRDELSSRIEIANAARADVFIVVHNNAPHRAWVPPRPGTTPRARSRRSTRAWRSSSRPTWSST